MSNPKPARFETLSRPPRDETKRPHRQPPTYGITEADLPF